MKKLAALLATAVIAVLAFLLIREMSAARDMRDQLAVTQSELEHYKSRVIELDRVAQDLTAENVRLRTAAATPPATPVAAAGPGPRMFTRAMPTDGRARPMGMLDSPEMRQLMAIDQKGRLDARYAELFRALNLPPDKLDRLKQLLVDRQNAPLDVLAAAHGEELFSGGPNPAMRELMQRETENIDTAIQELLGTTGYEEFQDFERTRAERDLVSRLANRLSYSEAPLTPEQSAALVDLLSAQRSATPPPSTTAGGIQGVQVAVAVGSSGDTLVNFHGGNDVPISEATVDSARTVLTPAQLAALQEIQAEQQAQRRVGELIRSSIPSPPAP